MNLLINQKFKNLIPSLSSEEYDNLKISIIAEGCRDAIILWNGVIVDGHNRYKICSELNLPFKTLDMEFSDEAEAEEWIMSNQLSRRNLSDVERGRIALKLKDRIAARAKDNCTIGINQYSPCPKLDNPSIDTKKELAKMACISHGTLAKIEKVDREAPEPIKEAMGKDISIDKAYGISNFVKTLPEENRQTEAKRLLENEIQKRDEKIHRYYKIYRKLREAIYISVSHFEYGTDEDIDIFLAEAPEKLSETINEIENSIVYLQKLKESFLSRNKIKKVK